MLENFNQLLEEMVDRKISINNYDMDIDGRCYHLDTTEETLDFDD